jgi:hypothetical protein
MTSVVALEHGNKELLDVGEEALAVDGPVEQAGRFDPVVTERREEGRLSANGRAAPCR